jgi:hypothetical protein
LNVGAQPDLLQMAFRINQRILHSKQALTARVVPDAGICRDVLAFEVILTGLLTAYARQSAKIACQFA